MGLRGKLRTIEGDRLAFWCAGCGEGHFVSVGHGTGPRWAFDGDYDKPTFHPSILVTWSEPSDNPDEFDDREKDKPCVCHSFVRGGRMQYLDDCTHALKGQTTELPPWKQRAADRETNV